MQKERTQQVSHAAPFALVLGVKGSKTQKPALRQELKKQKLSPDSRISCTPKDSSRSWCKSVAPCNPAAPRMYFRPGWAPVSCTKPRILLAIAAPSPVLEWLRSLDSWPQGLVPQPSAMLWHSPSVTVPIRTYCHSSSGWQSSFCFKGISFHLLSKKKEHGFLASYVSFLSVGPSTKFCKPEDPEKEEKEGN